jgi:hypothetical protein
MIFKNLVLQALETMVSVSAKKSKKNVHACVPLISRRIDLEMTRNFGSLFGLLLFIYGTKKGTEQSFVLML